MKDGKQGFFFGEILLDVSESDELEVVPPKSGQYSKANKGDTSPKKSHDRKFEFLIVDKCKQVPIT